MPHKSFYGNDPSFGKHKSFGGTVDPKNSAGHPPTQLRSQHTLSPSEVLKGTSSDPYQGTHHMVPTPDYYSNPNVDEHVRGFPSKHKEQKEDRIEEVALWVALGCLFTFFILNSLPANPRNDRGS